MTRYLVLEVAEGQAHDLTDFLNDMRAKDEGRAQLVAGEGFPLVVNVRILPRPLVQLVGQAGVPGRPLIYTTEV